jgi:hypothetical protein
MIVRGVLDHPGALRVTTNIGKGPAMANQQSRPSEFSINSDQQAVAFLNLPLRQGAGEASVTLRNNGSAGLIWLEPGSLEEGTSRPGGRASLSRRTALTPQSTS